MFNLANNFHQVSSFKSTALCVSVHTESVYVGLPSRIEVCNWQGTCKQTLAFTEAEGDPILMHINGNFLVALTNKSFLRIWDISRREARRHGSGHKFDDQG